MILFLKARDRRDTQTQDLFGDGQMALFTRPTPVKGYTDKNGRVVPAHTANMQHAPNKKDVATSSKMLHSEGVETKQERKMNNVSALGITYTFPIDAAIQQLRGVTVSGGKPSVIVVDRKKLEGVQFETKVAGKPVFAVISGKPDLAALVDEYKAMLEKRAQEKKDKLESAIPGVHEVLDLARSVSNDDYRYASEFNRMMEDEQNDGVRPPRPVDESKRGKLAELLLKYPRAALYLRAERQKDGASWADNTGKGAAGQAAMDVLASGGSIEQAEAALKERRNFVD